MAKAKSLYFGHSSVGQPVEVAQSETNKWFYRTYGWSGWGNSWNKWRELQNEIVHPTKIVVHTEYYDSPEHVELSKEEQLNYIEWGFTTLQKVNSVPRVRLPND